jgi:hypothetical protein
MPTKRQFAIGSPQDIARLDGEQVRLSEKRERSMAVWIQNFGQLGHKAGLSAVVWDNDLMEATLREIASKFRASAGPQEVPVAAGTARVVAGNGKKGTAGERATEG